MNEIQLTNHLTAQFMASTISRYEAEIREAGTRPKSARTATSEAACTP